MSTEPMLFFDADDTLWESARFFRRAGEDFIRLLVALNHDGEEMAELVHRRDLERLGKTGYGAEPYIDTLAHVLREVCPSPPESAKQALRDIESSLLNHPVLLYAAVKSTLSTLKARGYRMVVYTMGQQGHQGDKYRRSGLGSYFDACLIVPRKTPEALRAAMDGLGISPQRAAVIGNSARSDMNPALAIGARAVYIPNDILWAAEQQALSDPEAVQRLDRFEELLTLLP